MKKKVFFTIAFASTVLLFICGVQKIEAADGQNYQYVPLAPIGQYVPAQNATGGNLSGYINNMYKLGIGIATALAVLMLMWGGITYMTTDAIGGKEEAKEKINNAFLGLFIALASYLILKTINPDLLNTNLDSKIQTVNAPGTAGVAQGSTGGVNTVPDDANGGGVLSWDNWSDADQAAFDNPDDPGHDAAIAKATAIANSTDAINNSQISWDNWTDEDQAAFESGDDAAIAKAEAIAEIVAQNEGDASRGWVKNYGTVAANSLSGNTFPNQSWNAYALQQIQDSGILGLSPGDASKYFAGGTPTANGYLSLLASIANSESAFNPADNTAQHLKDGNSSFSSEGLYSLSIGDAAVKNVANANGVTPQQVLGNPYLSTQAAVQILKGNIQRSGVINDGTNASYWGPLIRNQ